MAFRIQARRGTAAEWESANPILLDGEWAIEKDTRKIKVGDGVTPWEDLTYFTQGEKGEKGDTGNSIQFIWNGTQLGIKVEGDIEYIFRELQGHQGEQGLQGASIVSVNFDNDDIVFIRDDIQEVVLKNAKTILKGEKGDIGPQGKAGIYIGEIQPLDPSIIWVDTSEESPVIDVENRLNLLESVRIHDDIIEPEDTKFWYDASDVAKVVRRGD